MKSRAYAGDESALATLRTALSVLLRLFAPFLPFVTEEVWSWWQEGSVHRADVAGTIRAAHGSTRTAPSSTSPARCSAEVRKAKTTAKKSLRADVERAVVTGTAEQLAALDAGRGDVIDAGRIAELVTEPGGELAVDVLLAD